MAFKAIYQLKNKKLWWIDVLLYFAVCLLIVSILCYFIFSIKNFSQRENIKKLNTALESIGTDQQKNIEKEVFNYQKKVNEFMLLLKNRKFVSAVFNFMEQQTFLNVWFDKFSMNRKDAEVDLSGEAVDMAAFSGQIASLERNEYIKKVTVLNSKLGNSGVVQFNLSLLMDPKIFNFSLQGLLSDTVTPSSGEIFNNE
ncbi:MAG: PilN domain-containing protein [Patescibacteria group bacterium]